MAIKVSRDIIPYFDQAVMDIFEKMIGGKAEKKGNYLDKTVLKDFQISAMMGFSGEINGNAAVSFTHQFAKEVVGNLLGEEPGNLDEATVSDGVGEMINMITGEAKVLMAGKTDINISLPIIIMGDGHEICVPDDVPRVYLMYESGGNHFSVQLAFKIK